MTNDEYHYRPNRLNEYGTVSFAWHDIESLKPKWSIEKMEKFLEENENELYEVMLDAGINCIDKLLKEIKEEEAPDATK